MFNEDVKTIYIEANTTRNKSLKNNATILFNRCAAYEQRLNKDISCFSTSEIVDCLKSFNSVSLESLMNARSQYKLYTDWCINNHVFTKDYQNHFIEINNDMLKPCLNDFMKEHRVITREYILNNLDNLINPAERFILLGLFEGIGAGSKIAYKEFENIRIEMFNTETHQIEFENRVIKYSNELYQIAREAANTYDTITYTKNGGEKHIKLMDDERIIKPAINARTYDYRNIIDKKLRKIKEGLNNPAINMQSLKESGRIEMVKKLMEKGLSLSEALSDKEVINTYGPQPAKKRYISNYFAE